MAIFAEEFRGNWPQTGVQQGDKEAWVLAKPLPSPLLWRIQEAIDVLKGKAHAVYFAPDA